MTSLSEDPEFVREVRRLIRKTSKRPWWLASVLLVALALTGAVYAAVLIFSQTLTSPGGIPPPIAANCASPQGNFQAVIGTSGGQVFGCGVSITPAFTVNNAGIFTPTFVLPAPYTDFFVFPSTDPVGNGSACAGYTGNIGLLTATPATLASGSYYYCAAFASYTAQPGSFTVSWSQ